jgi:hypothetical protein
MKAADGTVLNTNSKALRGKSEHEYRRTPGKARLLLLGDSFTSGAEVADDQTYSHYLETTLPGTEVQYHPDIVLLGFTYLDVYRNIETFFAAVNDEIQSVADAAIPVLCEFPPVSDREAYLRSVCEAKQVPCLFMGPRFREESRKGIDLNPWSHWNANGHSLGGEEIRKFLVRKTICSPPRDTLTTSCQNEEGFKVTAHRALIKECAMTPLRQRMTEDMQLWAPRARADHTSTGSLTRSNTMGSRRPALCDTWSTTQHLITRPGPSCGFFASRGSAGSTSIKPAPGLAHWLPASLPPCLDPPQKSNALSRPVTARPSVVSVTARSCCSWCDSACVRATSLDYG